LTSRKVVMGSFVLIVLAIGGLWLIDPDAFPITGPTTEAETPGPAADAAPPLSEAERLARLQRSLDSDRKYLERLNDQFKDPKSEYKLAEKCFQAVDAELRKARQAVQELKDAGKANEALGKSESLKDLQTRWQQNRDRFDLAIKEHRTLQENIAA